MRGPRAQKRNKESRPCSRHQSQKFPNLDDFLAHCHRRRHPSKSTLIYAGDDSDALYYIIDGSVTVLIEDDDGREMIVAYLNKGDFFGEMGVFDEDIPPTRSAWVKSRTDCEIAEISYAKFRELRESSIRMCCWPWASRWPSACA